MQIVDCSDTVKRKEHFPEMSTWSLLEEIDKIMEGKSGWKTLNYKVNKYTNGIPTPQRKRKKKNYEKA